MVTQFLKDLQLSETRRLIFNVHLKYITVFAEVTIEEKKEHLITFIPKSMNILINRQEKKLYVTSDEEFNLIRDLFTLKSKSLALLNLKHEDELIQTISSWVLSPDNLDYKYFIVNII